MNTEPPLTERAAARRASGETSGAGTHVCRRCGEVKEVNRVNSDKCKTCNGANLTGKGRTRTPAPPVEESRAVRTSVGPEVYAWLEAQAGFREMTVAEVVRTILTNRAHKAAPK